MIVQKLSVADIYRQQVKEAKHALQYKTAQELQGVYSSDVIKAAQNS